MPSQAHQSRPVPPTERYRRAFPHGKAFTGRGAPLPPAWCTPGAVRAVTRPVPEAAPTQSGRATASPGARLVVPTHLAGPGPVAVLIGCVYRKGKALRAKVNVSSPPRHRTSRIVYVHVHVQHVALTSIYSTLLRRWALRLAHWGTRWGDYIDLAPPTI